jgi:1-acyl-sn-glycerol-3-phosphate acyltransferase
MKQEQDSLSTGTTEAAGTDKEAQPVKPVKPPRSKPQKNLYEPYNTPPILYHALRWFAIFVFHITSRIRLRGLYNVPKKGAFIVASNHLSWTDIPLIPFHLPRKVIYMAKEEYFSSRLAWLVRLMGAFPVKRGEGDRQALRAGEEQLKKGNILVMFPEGTRSRTRTLAKAHAGMGMVALRSGVPVVPVAIWGSENVLKKFGAPVTISFGEPMVLTPKGKKITREDIDEATDKVMRKIAEMLPPEYRGVYGSSSKVGSSDTV